MNFEIHSMHMHSCETYVRVFVTARMTGMHTFKMIVKVVTTNCNNRVMREH